MRRALGQHDLPLQGRRGRVRTRHHRGREGAGTERDRAHGRRQQHASALSRLHESASPSTAGPDPPRASAFRTVGRRLVVHPTLERVRTILLGNHPGGVVMGVDVALAVPERGRTLVVGVPQVRRHLLADARAHVGLGPPERHHHGVRLGRPGQVDHRLGQVQRRLGEAHVLDGPGRGLGHQQRLGIGQPDVLAGQDHHAAGQEAGVLPRLDHAGHPVEAGVGVRAPHALDQRADLVVVLVGALVEQPAVAGPRHVVHGQHHAGVGIGRRRPGPAPPPPPPSSARPGRRPRRPPPRRRRRRPRRPPPPGRARAG